MFKFPTKFTAALVVAGTAFGAAAQARDQIHIVGSSTVFPFATTVAEAFGKSTNFKTPIVESTGSGGGLKLFCAGLGVDHPDITNASRRIKSSEVEACAKNGITEITEVKIGFDGIVMANSKEAELMNLSLQHVWLALATEVPANGMQGGPLGPNKFTTWKQIDPSLPDIKIEVLGPPPTSGTRDAFVELAMEGGCKTFPDIKAMKKADKKAYKKVCHSIREDGAFTEAGENDNLIVQKLVANPNAFGVFGFSFLDQNRDKVQGSVINGVAVSFESIADASYPVSRSMYFYVKNAHVGVIPGMLEYVDAFTQEDSWGTYGTLAAKGLIPLEDEERGAMREQALALTPLKM
jgi:phosphate transport system substrate-binding protein